MSTHSKGAYGVYVAYVNSIDGDDVAVIKIPALMGQTSLTIQPSSATGWVAPVAGEQRFVAISHDVSDVRWLV